MQRRNITIPPLIYACFKGAKPDVMMMQPKSVEVEVTDDNKQPVWRGARVETLLVGGKGRFVAMIDGEDGKPDEEFLETYTSMLLDKEWRKMPKKEGKGGKAGKATKKPTANPTVDFTESPTAIPTVDFTESPTASAKAASSNGRPTRMFSKTVPEATCVRGNPAESLSRDARRGSVRWQVRRPRWP